MNRIHRLGLAIAAAIATLTMAGAVVVQNFASARPTAQATAAQQAAADTQPTIDPTALDPQTIYVNPAATPRIVTITRTAPPTPTPAPTPTPGRGNFRGDDGGNDGGNDGGGD